MNGQTNYNYKVVRQFSTMSVGWGIVGMLVGVVIAAQLIWPELNLAVNLSALRSGRDTFDFDQGAPGSGNLAYIVCPMKYLRGVQLTTRQ